MMQPRSIHLSASAPPTSERSDLAVTASPHATQAIQATQATQPTRAICVLRANGATPLLIRPPRTAAAHINCNGALHAAAIELTEDRMQAPLRSHQTSLLSNDTYRCIKGKGAEPRYYLTQPCSTPRRV